jgi:hydroxypyruvate reductase
MTRVLQLVPLPVPSYRMPGDLPIECAFDGASLESQLAVGASQIVAVVTHSMHGMPEDLWDRLPSLRLIANFGVGLDRIDLQTASRRNVSVSYTPDLLTNDVADLAMAFMLSLSRRLLAGDTYVRSGSWGKEPFAPGRSLAGRRLGILGMGRIGQAIARRAAAFAMHIGYLSRSSVVGSWTSFADAVQLARWADVLVAALPGGSETYHLVDKDVFNALGSDGIFINIARGSVVDESALVDALRSGTIAAAGLDVYDNQPVDGTRFHGLFNVLLTPHIGSLTVDTRSAMANSVYGNVRALLSGESLHDVAKLGRS